MCNYVQNTTTVTTDHTPGSRPMSWERFLGGTLPSDERDFRRASWPESRRSRCYEPVAWTSSTVHCHHVELIHTADHCAVSKTDDINHRLVIDSFSLFNQDIHLSVPFRWQQVTRYLQLTKRCSIVQCDNGTPKQSITYIHETVVYNMMFYLRISKTLMNQAPIIALRTWLAVLITGYDSRVSHIWGNITTNTVLQCYSCSSSS